MKADGLRPLAGAMLTHGMLLLELVQVEWEIEKARLWRLIVISAAGLLLAVTFVLLLSLFCVLLAWDTPYRLLTVGMLLAAYAAGMYAVWRKWQHVHRQSTEFSGVREELVADMTMLKHRLTL